MKVYCIGCKYLRGSECCHKENIKKEESKEDWLHKATIYIYKKKPKEINKHNDCIWYALETNFD